MNKSVSEGVSRECVSMVFSGETVHIVFINEFKINKKGVTDFELFSIKLMKLRNTAIF